MRHEHANAVPQRRNSGVEGGAEAVGGRYRRGAGGSRWVLFRHVTEFGELHVAASKPVDRGDHLPAGTVVVVEVASLTASVPAALLITVTLQTLSKCEVNLGPDKGEVQRIAAWRKQHCLSPIGRQKR